MHTRRSAATFRPRVAIVALSLVAGSFALLAGPAGAVVQGQQGRIAFASNRDGDNDIYVMRPDGTAVTQLTVNTADDHDPAVSADGTKIAFISDRDGTPDLWTMNIDGTNVKKVTKNGNGIIESHPTWSPNGLAIGFAGKVGTDSDIYTIKPSGQGQLDLTPTTEFFDANASWSPGGFDMAFDRTDASGHTNIYEMLAADGSGVTQLTSSGTDSHPSYGPNSTKAIVFESGRDNPVPGPSFFASVKKPDGVAVTENAVLVTQLNKTTVRSIDATGAVGTFGTLPVASQAEKYLAVSPGLGGFPAGNVYVTINNTVYVFPPTGGTATLFATLPDILNGNNGITFDTVGTFGFKMIVVDHKGHVVTVDSTGASTLIAFVHQQLEGPAVAPLSFAPYGGQLLATDETTNGGTVWAIDPNGTFSSIGDFHVPEGVDIIPSTPCNFGTSGGGWFVAMEDQDTILKFPATDFTGLGGQALVPSELVTDLGLFSSNGSTITVSTFHGPIGQPDLEGSDFAPCPSGGAGARQGATGTPPTQEIYSLDTKTLAQTRLTSNTFDDVRPAFSPDGGTIVFATDRDDPNQQTCEPTSSCTYEVYTMGADGQNQVNRSNNLTAQDTAPDWQTVNVAVAVSDFQFSPVTANGTLGVLGETIQWDFFGPSAHTATDSSSNSLGNSMGLFDSGSRDAGAYYPFTFFGAGRYQYTCTIHPTQMNGTVKVPINVSPGSGGITTQFTVTWASAPPKIAGYVFDVQILRPNTSDFVPWRTGVTSILARFTPDVGTGVYQFQARLRNSNIAGTCDGGQAGACSDYSSPKSITVS